MNNNIGYICLRFLHCVFSNVPSKNQHEFFFERERVLQTEMACLRGNKSVFAIFSLFLDAWKEHVQKKLIVVSWILALKASEGGWLTLAITEIFIGGRDGGIIRNPMGPPKKAQLGAARPKEPLNIPRHN